MPEEINNSMTEALRRAIKESKLPYAMLERETGVLRQTLINFVAGKQTIRLDSADKLAHFFGLTVTENLSTGLNMKKADRERKFWVFYDPGDKEHWDCPTYRGNCAAPKTNDWTCNAATKKGDLALLYAKRPFSSIVALFKVIKDAEREPNMPDYAASDYWCRVKTLAIIEPRLKLKAMKEDEELRLAWGLVRSQFQSRGVPEIKSPVIGLLEKRIPELTKFDI